MSGPQMREVGGVKIFSARFVKSALELRDLPKERLPQIAFLGRSNVGKSSLLNALMGEKKMVKVSSTPGKTRELNFFCVNEALYVVDLPGVGYAKVGFETKDKMAAAIRDYIERSEDLKGVVYLVDIRLGGTKIDIETVSHIRAAGRPVLIVASKRDKVNQSEFAKSMKKMRENFGLESNPLSVSALKKTGLSELWAEILQAALAEA